MLERLYPDAKCALDHRNALELLVATILSAQCTDERVNLVTPALFERYRDAAAFAGADQTELEAMIRSTGFFRNKARAIRECCADIVTRYGGQVPRTLDQLTTLRGVGRKTANVVLGNAYGIPGLVVDTHVTRLSNRLGLTRETRRGQDRVRAHAAGAARSLDGVLALADPARPPRVHRAQTTVLGVSVAPALPAARRERFGVSGEGSGGKPRGPNPRRRAGAVAPSAASLPADAGAERAALALWIALGVFAAARALLAFAPGMWLWSLNLQRFMSPPIGWGLWAIAALALIPAVARSFEGRLARAGDALAGEKLWPALIATALVTLWVAGSADNARFVGDFLLRQGTVEQSGSPAVLFPQALPLDVFIHYTLPAALRKANLMTANSAARALGMLNAAWLAWLACRFVRVLKLRGSAAMAAWSVVVFGGYLGMFTGYSKSLAELVVVALAIAVCGVQLAREGRGALALGVALAIGFALHRAAAIFLVPAAVAWGFGARRLDRAAWLKPATMIAIALPLAALAISAPRIVSTIVNVDATVHLAPSDVKRMGVLAAAFSGPRPADFLNLVMLLSPVALAVLVAALAGGAAPREGAAETNTGAGARAVLIALALPLALIAPFIHPAQGLFRDWDDFAATGMTLSLLAAFVLGGLLARAGARRWVAVTAAAAAFSASAQWLAINSSADESLARARAIATEPPAREESERAGVWDYLGIRNFRLGRWPESAEAFSHAAEFAPSPRMLQEWAMAETMAGHLREAQAVYHQLVAKAPGNISGWLGLGAVASRIPDVDDAFLAANKLLELDPNNATGRQLMEYLRKTYPQHP